MLDPAQTKRFNEVMSTASGQTALINGDVHFHSVDGSARRALDDMAWELRRVRRGGGGRRR